MNADGLSEGSVTLVVQIHERVQPAHPLYDALPGTGFDGDLLAAALLIVIAGLAFLTLRRSSTGTQSGG